jgi:NADPH-dependent 2,4-dienoyl-CoA reductase/sulfur reductase-like enzyme
MSFDSSSALRCGQKMDAHETSWRSIPFTPSLIWVSFGKRSVADISFPLQPTFEAHGIEFIHAAATSIDVVGKRIVTATSTYTFDYLVVATAFQNNFDTVEGLGPNGNAYNITTMGEAIHSGKGWKKPLNKPADVVIGQRRIHFRRERIRQRSRHLSIADL